MELHNILIPILGVTGLLVMAGLTFWQKKKVREDDRRRRTLSNLRAALGG